MALDRRKVIYSGRVQGVGFRATAQSLAATHPISGYVHNLADGRVELLVEGETDAVDLFLLTLRVKFRDMIDDVTQESNPVGARFFPGFFSIRF